jgi:hypothetical protein
MRVTRIQPKALEHLSVWAAYVHSLRGHYED